MVQGNVFSAAATTLGAGAKIYQHDLSFADPNFLGYPNAMWTFGNSFWGLPPYSGDHVGQLEGAQSYLYDLKPSTAPVSPTHNMYSGITHNIGTHQTWLPGVYTIEGSLSVSAAVTITLDNSSAALAEAALLDVLDGVHNHNFGGDFIINVRDYVSFGAKTKVVWSEPNGTIPRVIWNVPGTYISLGAEADIEGLLLANTYIATGAESFVKGGAYSATSYVVVGAVADITDAQPDKSTKLRK